VAPLAHAVPDAWTGFQHDRPEAAFQNMRGGGEADWTGSDDGDCLGFAQDVLLSI